MQFWIPRCVLLSIISLIIVLMYTVPIENFLNTSHVTVELNSPPSLSITYQQLQANLCGKTYSPANVSDSCPNRTVITMFSGGRTGNQIWEYASIFALGKDKPHLQPYVPQCILDTLKDLLDGLTLKSLQNIAHCSFTLQDNWETCPEQSQGVLVVPQYHFQKKEVVKWADDIQRELNLRKPLKDKANNFLKTFGNKTFISIHVRRTDYENYIKRKYNGILASKQFYINAMNYYRDKFKNCLFLFISDDPTWCFKNYSYLKDVYIVGYTKKTTAFEDLALMSACNHSIFDYGTFGWWGAFLANGEVVYYNITQNLYFQQVLPHWIMMN
ncbi:hypothetical protein ABEB36_011874 [Hypothenemus hampei]|uniref:L-Fucosyltransferase n=1 Tax=Hypothenemus hampei TaxID=57062 RepID=A0ABD1E9C8_HYPHA